MDQQKEFIKQLRRYQKGSVSRRHFLGVTGLGTAMTVLAGAMPAVYGARKAFAGSIGDKVSLTTWPNYHSQANLDKFGATTGAKVEMTVFGSNEEMFAKLKAGGTGWDVFVPTNYTIENYVKEDLIVPLDLSQIPNYQPQNYTDQRFTQPGTVNGKVYAVHKDWGTTGYSVNTTHISEPMTSWKDFWDLARGKYTGRAMVHDYQLTTIGNALKYYGHSFNSLDEKELAEAEKLLLDAKPHLFAINSDYQPSMRSGDAWLTVAWTGDANQLHRDMPEIIYVIGKEGGEIWSDFYAIPKEAPNKPAAYALINYLLDPAVNKDEVLAHGYPVADKRVFDLLPKEIQTNAIMYPAAELLSPLEFGAAATLTNPARAEIMARFKSA
ncbi:MAG TPA: spermidine/putrescine ABC transporter substrate-binding protein [Dongiaceae bacterium]|nr:spermidine/putrescine ABC transporter substrate-binding protein [Dongiaceae bacterium]